MSDGVSGDVSGDVPGYPEPDGDPEHDEAAERRRLLREAERRRRRAEVFGDALPVTTSDERDPGRPQGGSGVGDRWWREQVPPHHG